MPVLVGSIRASILLPQQAASSTPTPTPTPSPTPTYLGQYRATPASNVVSPAGSYAQLTDLSDAGNHYGQTTDNKKPSVATATTSLGSKDVVSFVGSPQLLIRAPFWWNATGGFTIAGIVKIPSGQNTQDIISECSTSNAVPFVFIQDNAAGGLRVNYRNDASVIPISNVNIIPTGLLDDTPHLFIITDNGAGQMKGYLDDPTTAVATINYTRGTTTLETSTLLARSRAGSEVAHHAGGIFELDIMQGVMDATWLGARRAAAQASHGTP